jgi:hypothetical protein
VDFAEFKGNQELQLIYISVTTCFSVHFYVVIPNAIYLKLKILHSFFQRCSSEVNARMKVKMWLDIENVGLEQRSL